MISSILKDRILAQDLESILPNFVLIYFPIFDVQLSHFVTKNNAIYLKLTSLISKNGKMSVLQRKNLCKIDS